MSSLSSISAAPKPQVTSPTPGLSILLPPKLLKRILELEYIDMVELMPESWSNQGEEQCCHQSRRNFLKGPIMDIQVWLECYSYLVGVLSMKYPDKVMDLMAYQRIIIKAQRTFMGDGWMTYDACFRRKAAFNKSLDWGQLV